MKSRARLLIKGIVQGVGFRPFIYGLAKFYSLNGWVLNSTEGVGIEVEGNKDSLDEFVNQIRVKLPPLAMIDSIDLEYLTPVNYDGFVIRHSKGDKDKYVKISPDICICNDCLTELFDVDDRRYRYPFINCTNCGPRFTIVKDIPYDRENTTMQSFKMCPLCQAEYDDPMNRRFHAQPNACTVCGPSVTLEDLHGKSVLPLLGGTRSVLPLLGGTRIECDDPINKAIELMIDGKIIAVKGIGGFHLACDATNDSAVKILRERKRRTFKPFAIMSKNLERIKEYCIVSDEESKLLQCIQRPIVLLKKLSGNLISESVAPSNNYIGVMLPYSPLHYVLLDSPLLALVMTSGNISEEPIVVGNDEAKRRLSDLADYFLFHNRDIQMRCDDSVTKVWNGHQVMLRRSRGYAPHPVDLDFSMKEILACGGELKNTFCLTKDNHAFISHHIGDLQNIEAYKYYQDSVEHYKNLFRIKPEAIAYDLHPDYLSTKYALEQKDIKLIGVQHHHAHVVSCMAENGLNEKVIGVACDGTGYGTDGAIWGCEFMIADQAGFQRRGHLKYVTQPGGDISTKETYRMAISYLYSVYGDKLFDIDIPLFKRIDHKKLAFIKSMTEKGVNAPLTSSCGRLFDAVSSLIDVRDDATYEAQAAIELEMIAETGISENYGYNIISIDDEYIINLDDMFQEIISDLNHKVSKEIISARFHNTVADFIISMCEKLRIESDIKKVALSGGTFQNTYLITEAIRRLTEKEFITYFHKRVPTNDGGLSLGQAVVANSLAKVY